MKANGAAWAAIFGSLFVGGCSLILDSRGSGNDAGTDSQGNNDSAPACPEPMVIPAPPCVSEDNRTTVVENTLVIAQTGAEVSDRLIAPGIFPSLEMQGDFGSLLLGCDGGFELNANGVPGKYEIGIDLDAPGLERACVFLEIVDPEQFKVMQGDKWEDPLSWSPAGVPLAGDSVWIPDGNHSASGSQVAGALLVGTGAELNLNGGLAIESRLLAAGEISGSPITISNDVSTELGGRLPAISCMGPAFLSAATVTDALTASGSCGIVVGPHRLSVQGDFTADGITLTMTKSPSTLVVQGNISLAAVTPLFFGGRVVAHGNYTAAFVFPMILADFVIRLESDADQTIDASLFTDLELVGGGAVTFLSAATVAGTMTTERATNAPSVIVAPNTLRLLDGFSTTTPNSFDFASCDDTGASSDLCSDL